MNKIVNKSLLAGDKFMPKMHLKQPGFTYSTCWPFRDHKFMTSTRKGEMVLKFVTGLWILLFLSNKSIVHFCRWWGWGSKSKETGDSWYIYRNELDKACFQHDVGMTILKI